MSLALVLFAQHDLRHPFAVAQIDKRQHAKITLFCDPTH
jgi:hypothetical protein